MINLVKNKWFFYKSIYNLRLIKQKMLITYIKTNLINKFIHFF